jgi:hypothetical protein
LLILMLASFAAEAQTGTIKGFVYDRRTGEPLIYTNVGLQGTSYGAQTDLNGYYSITGIPVGGYTLFTTQLGFDTATAAVDITSGGLITKNLQLNPKGQLGGTSGIQLKDVQVTSRKTEQLTQIRAGTTTITPRDIKLLPSAGGEPDLAQFLQVTPGVVFTGDQGGQLYIRGGSPSQTGILLDGVTIYNPFHSIGLYSVFETDAIRSADVSTAGFNAEYGNRTSAIVDVRTKDGNKNRLSGKLSVSPIMARAMLEGPIVKRKNDEAGSTTFLLSIKNSYLDKTSTSVYEGLGKPFSTGLPYSFTDLYGKVTFSGGSGSKLNLFGFSFDDKANVINPNSGLSLADFHWKAIGAGSTFVVTPGSSAALISGKFAYSRYDIDFMEASRPGFPRTSAINGFEGGIDFTYFLRGYSQLKYGIELSGQSTSLNYRNNDSILSTVDRNNTLASLFLMYRKNIAQKFIIEPGLRIQYYSSLNVVSPEPRIGMKYNATQNVRFKAAAGIYSQNIISTKSDRDIVNFFTGFTLSPSETIKDQNGKDVNNNLLRAYHGVIGVEVDAFGVNFTLEPWYKKFTRVIELNRNRQATDPSSFQAGEGEAYGVDLAARYSKGRVYLWGTASYQSVTNTFRVQTTNGTTEMQTYATPFDRRFNLNLVAAYTAGRRRDWELSARYNLGSPFPFTQTQGFFENVNPTATGLNTNVAGQNGSLGLIYSNEINGGRLSYYHRLDLSVRKRFIFTTTRNLEVTAAVTNAYNRNNIFYVDRISNERIYQLPIFPSVNATFNF